MTQQEKRDDPNDEMRGATSEAADRLDLTEEKKSAVLSKRAGHIPANKTLKKKLLTKEEEDERNNFINLLISEKAFKTLSMEDTFIVGQAIKVAFGKYVVEKRNRSVLSIPEMSFSGEKDFIEAIESYARSHADSLPHGHSVADALGSFLKAHFARARTQHAPPVPERKYVPRQDEIIPFLREVWGEWLAGGYLERQTLYDHDPTAYSALSNWLRNNELPDDMDIPSNREVNDRELENEWFHRDDVPRIASAIARRARFHR